MSRNLIFVLSLLLVELAVGGGILYWKYQSPAPPMPNLSVLDRFTAADLEAKINDCRTPKQWYELANLLIAYGFYPEACSAFERASQLLPDSAEVAFDYGFCLSRAGRLDEANDRFERAIELKSEKSPAATFFIGRNHLRAGDPELAKEYFRKSTIIPLAKYELAKVLVRQGEYDEPKELLKEVIQSEPDNIQAFTLLAQIAQREDDRKSWLSYSIEGSSKWLRIESPFGAQREMLMDVLKTIGYEKRLQDYSVLVGYRDHTPARRGLKELQEAEWNLAAQEALIRCAVQSGQIPVSIKLLEERFDRFGYSSHALAKLGESHLRMERPDKALEAWELGGMLATDGHDKNCYQNIGRYYLETVKDEEKSTEYQQLAIVGFILAALQYEEFNKAYGLSKSAVELSPENAECHFLLGRSSLGVAKADEAIASLKRCLELDPTHGRALRQLEAIGVTLEGEASLAQ